MKYMCSKCYSKKFFIFGNNGLYCEECGKWIKWLNKDEIRVFEHKQLSKNELSMKYTRDEVAYAIENLKDWDDDNLFHEAVDKVLAMFKNMK